MSAVRRIAMTPGEPAGIGPDLCAILATRSHDCELVIISDPDLLHQRANQLGISLLLREFDEQIAPAASVAGTVNVLPVRMSSPAVAGRTDPDNAAAILRCLDLATDGCLSGKFDALVTGPVNKAVINDAGYAFTGHTEYLAERANTHRVVMMLANQQLRVALATTHMPLSAVSGALSVELLKETLDIIDRDLKTRFGIIAPRIAVCGLNPHAGEGGHLGNEEIRIITPAIEQMRSSGLNISGPVPADTVFVASGLDRFDVVLAMYHDQGLPVLKHRGFGQAVNITLGLPFIRTSVDHGTALELAGSGKADTGSMDTAIATALQMANHANRP